MKLSQSARSVLEKLIADDHGNVGEIGSSVAEALAIIDARAPTWRPVADAPTDGTPQIVGCKADTSVLWMVAAWGYGGWWSDGSWLVPQPTLWLPIQGEKTANPKPALSELSEEQIEGLVIAYEREKNHMAPSASSNPIDHLPGEIEAMRLAILSLGQLLTKK